MTCLPYTLWNPPSEKTLLRRELTSAHKQMDGQKGALRAAYVKRQMPEAEKARFYMRRLEHQAAAQKMSKG